MLEEVNHSKASAVTAETTTQHLSMGLIVSVPAPERLSAHVDEKGVDFYGLQMGIAERDVERAAMPPVSSNTHRHR